METMTSDQQDALAPKTAGADQLKDKQRQIEKSKKANAALSPSEGSWCVLAFWATWGPLMCADKLFQAAGVSCG
jgi:hypothetical protein